MALVGAGALWILVFGWAHWGAPQVASLQARLEWLAPAAFVVTVLVVLLGGFVAAPELWAGCRALSPRDWGYVVAVLALTVSFRVATIPGTERLYFDEHAYMQIARGIAHEGRARLAFAATTAPGAYRCEAGEYYHWSMGWPTLLAGALRLTGDARWTGWMLNLLLSLAATVLVALVAAALFPGTYVWLAALVSYACLPANQVWSRSSSAEVLAAGAALLAIWCAIRFASRPHRHLGLVLAGAVALAAQTRNEMIIMVPVTVMIMVARGGRQALERAWWPLAGACLLLLPQALHLGVVSRHYDPVAAGSGFALKYFFRNLSSFGGYLRHEPVTLVLLLLALWGVMARRQERSVRALGGWVLAAFGLPLFYFGGSFRFHGGERFILAWAPALSLCAGLGIYDLGCRVLKKPPSRIVSVLGLGVFLLVMWWSGIHTAREDRATFDLRSDCSYLRAILPTLPMEAMVVTTNVPAVVTEGRSAVFIDWLTQDPKRLAEWAVARTGTLFYIVTPHMSPHKNKSGIEADRRLLSRFQAQLVSNQDSPQGPRFLYRLIPKGMSGVTGN